MALPNSTFNPNLVTNSTLANQIDDKIMAVLTLAADILGVDLSATRTVTAALAQFDATSGHFTNLIAQGPNSDNGVQVIDADNAEQWRVTADGSDVNTRLILERYNGATWDAVLEVNPDGVIHNVLGPLGTSTITEITAGTGLSGGGTTGVVNIDIENLGVGTNQLANAAVTAAKLASSSVVNASVAVGAAIDGAKFANTSIYEEKLKSDAGDMNKALISTGGGAAWSLVGTASIADGAITTSELDVGCVNEAALADGAVTEGKIGANAVTNGKIMPGAVIEGKLAPGAVTNAKIGANAVTYDKLDATGVTAGKIIKADGDATPAWDYATTASISSGVAADGTVLTANGAGGCAWEAASSGFNGSVIHVSLSGDLAVPNITSTDIPWTVENIDTGNSVSLGAGDTTIHVASDGYYLIHAQVVFEGSSETGNEFCAATIEIGAATWGNTAEPFKAIGTTADHWLKLTTVAQLTTATDVSVSLYQNSGGAVNVLGGERHYTYLMLTKVSD